MARDLGVTAGRWRASEATAINDVGQVAGVMWAGGLDPNRIGASPHGFLWQDRETVDLGTLGDANGRVWAINSKGQIVATRRYHAAVWRDGKWRDLAVRAQESSEASDINDQGVIVGSWQRTWDSDAPVLAAVWVGGRLSLLPLLPGGKEGSASAINDQGQIVGWSTTRGGTTHSVLWTLKRSPLGSSG
jgi:probable HAF family extracellular repeat protein